MRVYFIPLICSIYYTYSVHKLYSVLLQITSASVVYRFYFIYPFYHFRIWCPLAQIPKRPDRADLAKYDCWWCCALGRRQFQIYYTLRSRYAQPCFTAERSIYMLVCCVLSVEVAVWLARPSHRVTATVLQSLSVSLFMCICACGHVYWSGV